MHKIWLDGNTIFDDSTAGGILHIPTNGWKGGPDKREILPNETLVLMIEFERNAIQDTDRYILNLDFGGGLQPFLP